MGALRGADGSFTLSLALMMAMFAVCAVIALRLPEAQTASASAVSETVIAEARVTES
jgi:hypothetical protein